MVFLDVRGHKGNDIYKETALRFEAYDELLDAGFNIRAPLTYEANSISELISLVEAMPNLQEGVVVKDLTTGKRFKLKSTKYLTAHGTTSGNGDIREKLVELILTGEDEEFVSYFKQYLDIVIIIKLTIADMIFVYKDYYEQFKSIESQKDFALAIKDLPGNGLLFGARKTGKDIKCVFDSLPKTKKVRMVLEWLDANKIKID